VQSHEKIIYEETPWCKIKAAKITVFSCEKNSTSARQRQPGITCEDYAVKDPGVGELEGVNHREVHLVVLVEIDHDGDGVSKCSGYRVYAVRHSFFLNNSDPVGGRQLQPGCEPQESEGMCETCGHSVIVLNSQVQQCD
jgi:hypothetical protein